jgi:hypothetical protein
MNHLTVYAILQADQIRLGIILLAAFYSAYRLFVVLLSLALDFAYHTDIDKEKKAAKPDQSKVDALAAKRLELTEKTKKHARKCGVWFLVAMGAMAFFPTSKTLAASYLLPMMANSVAVERDFPELYNLAVQKLKEQLTTK